jgi:hypothetical protein
MKKILFLFLLWCFASFYSIPIYLSMPWALDILYGIGLFIPISLIYISFYGHKDMTINDIDDHYNKQQRGLLWHR